VQPPLQPLRCYSPFSLYGVLEHGADFKAAARQLAKDGYGDQTGTAKPSSAPNSGGDRKWGKPEPLIGECPSIPYPMDALPAEIREAVVEVNDFTQSP